MKNKGVCIIPIDMRHCGEKHAGWYCRTVDCPAFKIRGDEAR